MLIKMTPGTEERAAQMQANGQTPLFVPAWYADQRMRAEFWQRASERGLQIAREMAAKERQQQDSAYQEEQNRKLRDTKPLVFSDTSDKSRPVFVVGGGQSWREDLRDLALRTKEKPDPKKNPRYRELNNVHNRIDMLADVNKRQRAGRAGVWHFHENPISISISAGNKAEEQLT